MIFRLLNWQGMAGIAATVALALLLAIQKGETSHWKKQSATFEQLYRQDQTAFAVTVANYRAAAAEAAASDQANFRRVAAEQAAITERTANDFEARLAAARADAQRLRIDAQADSGAGRNTSMPGLSDAARGSPQAAVQDRLPASDALTASEQAIQLDELIKWIHSQSKVDNNPPAGASPSVD